LWISNHGGGKNHLAYRDSLCPNVSAYKRRAVFKDEVCLTRPLDINAHIYGV